MTNAATTLATETLDAISAQLAPVGLTVSRTTDGSLGHEVTGWDDPSANHGFGLLGKKADRARIGAVKLVARRLHLRGNEFEGYFGGGVRAHIFGDCVYVAAM